MAESEPQNVPTTPNTGSSSSLPAMTTTSPDVESSPLLPTMVTPKAPPKTTPHRNIRTPQVDPIPARRSSTRTIKRKKFDDEMVESSLYNKIDRQTPSRPKIPSLVPLSTPSTSTTSVIIPVEKAEVPVIVPVVPVVPPPPVVSAPPAPIPEKKINLPPAKSSSRPSKSSSKRPKRPRAVLAASSKDLGRWKAQDDLLLINAVQQCNDLSLVHTGVKFSCHFTLKEIQERWYALLYDQQISKLSVQTMKMLHPDIIGQVQAKALFSNREEELLGTIPSTKNPSIERFQDLLNEHPEDFYPLRTPKALHTHWLLLKQYHLLPDQSVQPMPRGDHILNFSDAEDAIHDEELQEPRDEAVEKELMVADRRCKKEIRHLEEEMPKLQCLVDNVTGISPPDFDNQTLAVLRGRLVRYLMRSKEITLGRATKDTNVDVDLSLEGPAWKISRQQGVIKLRPCGDFYLANEGKRPIYVDGKPIIKGNKQKLFHNSVVEISSLRFIFLINEELVKTMRTEIPKLIPNIT